jgi:hypothetical protein
MNARRYRPLAASFATLFSIAVPASALAQATPAPATTAAPAPAAPAATPATAPAAPPAEAAAEAKSPEVFPRYRWGISAVGGPLLGVASGGIGGVDARFGSQINNLFGVYAQPVALLGGGVNANVSGASATGVVLGGVGVLADVTFLDMFFIAAGPELMGGVTGSGSSGTAGTSASGSSGAFFSIATRAGVNFGSTKPEKRQGFSLNLDFRTVFTPGDPLLIPALALGYDSF